MSPLAKEIIEKLNKEEDIRVLAEVLDFYEYLKQKSNKNLYKKWADITDEEPTDDERKIYKQYKKSNEELTPLENIINELNLDGE